jgi:hypothetical protein
MSFGTVNGLDLGEIGVVEVDLATGFKGYQAHAYLPLVLEGRDHVHLCSATAHGETAEQAEVELRKMALGGLLRSLEKYAEKLQPFQIAVLDEIRAKVARGEACKACYFLASAWWVRIVERCAPSVMTQQIQTLAPIAGAH